MGERENVIIIEDDREDLMKAVKALKSAGHIVVQTYTSYPTAMQGIESGLAESITVAVVDGNLEYNKLDCQDGREISAAIKKARPEIVVVAYTSSSQNKAIFGDAYVGKSPSRLAREVTDIPR